MEWAAGIIAAIVAFIVGFLPSLGEEVRYRLTPNSSLERSEIVVLFGGDMMFDRSVRVAMHENGEDFIFSCLGDTLGKPDIVVANLEGPITGHASRSVDSKVGELNNTKFTFASSTAALLKRQGIDIVSIANNHAQDFGPEGVRSTMRFLEDARVGYFGDPFAETEYRIRENGVSISFIGYNQFQDYIDGEWRPSTTTIERIRAAREAGYMPVVFAHWGEEYVPEGTTMKRLAREWIDAGAEMVVGAHPHVVQGHEEYAGKYVYYSLGNFIFDQYFSEDVRDGLLLGVRFGHSGVNATEEIPIRLERDRRTCLKSE